MTTQCEDPCAQFPIHEFDRIGSELARKSTWYAKMTIELDRITAPNYHPTPTPTPTPTPLTPARSGFIYKGIFEPCRSDIDIHLGVLRRLWTEFPNRRESMASVIQGLGRVRRYVARGPADLFPHRSIAWALQFSRPLIDGWWVDTNMNCDQMEKIMVAAVRAAGMRWGDEVRVRFNGQLKPSIGN